MNIFFCLCAFVALISIIEGKSSNVVEISFVENQHSALRNSYLNSECLDSKQKKEERNKCRVCGVEDYVSNEVNSTSFGCNNENRNIQFFNDPIVQGDILTQAKISVTGVFCGATVHFGINNQLIGTYYPTKENCKTCEEGSCVPASTIEFSSKHFDLNEGGFPTYFYGVSNKFWTQVESGNVKLVSASIELLSEQQPVLAARQVCPSVRPIAGGFRQEDFCYASSNNMTVPPNCFYFDALFNNWNRIRLNKIKVQTIQCTNKNRDFCHEVETQDYQINTTTSLPYACFQSWSCKGIAPHQPCVRYYDISLVAKSGGCSPFTYTIAVTNPDINIKKFNCKLETMKIGAPVTTGVTTGITTALTTGVTTGPVTTGPVTTGDISTGDITTGPVTTGDISTGLVTTGDITTAVTSCSIQPYTASNKLDIDKTGGSQGTLGVFKNAPRVMQLLVLSNEGPSTSRKLIGVVFKRHTSTGSHPLLSSTKFDITISKPANSITTLSTGSTFTSNEANPVVVRSGPISIAADTFATQNTYPDSYYICFDTPVTIQGSFVVRINHDGFPSDFAVIAAPHGNKALLSTGTPFTQGTNTVSFPSMRFIYEEELP